VRPEAAAPLVAIGLAAGFLSALLGVGGGVVIVPLLVLWIGLDVRQATASSLVAIGISAAAGVASYWALGDVRPGYAALVGVPAAAGAVGGAALQRRLHAHLVEYLFAALLVAVAIWLLAT
jgi:uncharacterized membrane protein YfcA